MAEYVETKKKEMESIGRQAIEVCNLYVNHASAEVLRDVNLTVDRGEIYMLLGLEQSGKHTVLSTIAGLSSYQSGSVCVTVHRGLGATRPQQGFLAYMPLNTALYDTLTVDESLWFHARTQGILPTQRFQRFLSALLALPPAQTMVGSLDIYVQRRVSLACTLVTRSPVMLLNDPTMGMDQWLRQRVWRYLRRLASTHDVAVLATTTLPNEAIYAHRVGILNHGRIVCQDSPCTLIGAYNKNHLEEVFEHVLQQPVPLATTVNTSKTVISIDDNQINLALPRNTEHHYADFKEFHWSNNYKYGRILSQKMWAMMVKNLLTLFRSPFFYAMVMLVPLWMFVNLGHEHDEHYLTIMLHLFFIVPAVHTAWYLAREHELGVTQRVNCSGLFTHSFQLIYTIPTHYLAFYHVFSIATLYTPWTQDFLSAETFVFEQFLRFCLGHTLLSLQILASMAIGFMVSQLWTSSRLAPLTAALYIGTMILTTEQWLWASAVSESASSIVHSLPYGGSRLAVMQLSTAFNAHESNCHFWAGIIDSIMVCGLFFAIGFTVAYRGTSIRAANVMLIVNILFFYVILSPMSYCT